MHQGAIPAPNSHNAQYGKPEQAAGPPGTTVSAVEAPNTSAIDDLISSASKQADVSATQTSAPSVATEPAAAAPSKEKPADEKKEKEKSKATRLVYSDNEVSPEERMATLSRYAFAPHHTVVAA